jgi:hypothetical protein
VQDLVPVAKKDVRAVNIYSYRRGKNRSGDPHMDSKGVDKLV